jgi:nucleotide-binding universal stress UspA family protein
MYLLSLIVPSRELEYADSIALSEPMDDGARCDAALAYLTSVAKELRDSGARVELRVEMHEHPAQVILDAAAQQHDGLIALSTHGLGGHRG